MFFNYELLSLSFNKQDLLILHAIKTRLINIQQILY